MARGAALGPGGLWLRLLIFVVALNTLALALGFALDPVLSRLTFVNTQEGSYALATVLAAVPAPLAALLAALLAWLVPRPVPLRAGGWATSPVALAVFILLSWVLVSFVSDSAGRLSGWADSAGIAGMAWAGTVRTLAALPGAVATAFVVAGVWWALARRCTSPGWAGVVASLVVTAAELVGVVARLAMPGLPAEAATAGPWETTLLPTLSLGLASAVFFGGVGRLLDGRGWLSRTLYVGAALAVARGGYVLIPAGGAAAGWFTQYGPYLLLGLIAWFVALPAARRARPSIPSRAGAVGNVDA